MLKHFPRYSSEIAYALYNISHYIQLHSDNIMVYSLGCGPASELFATVAVLKRLGLEDRSIHYKGFDLDMGWDEITSFERNLFRNLDVQFLNFDMFNYIIANNEHINILILNYLLSDVMRYNKNLAYYIVNQIYNLLSLGFVDNVVINDIALFYANGPRSSAYVCMRQLESLIDNRMDDLLCYSRYRFTEPNPYQVEYGTLLNNSVLFPVNQSIINTYTPFMTCGSIVLEARRN